MHFFYCFGFGIVATVAERFILGLAAAAKGKSVAHVIVFAVRGFNWNPAAHPDWSLVSCQEEWYLRD